MVVTGIHPQPIEVGVFCREMINEYGDGWNEPREVEPDCTKMDELAKMGCMNFDFDNRLPLCPCFEEN